MDSIFRLFYSPVTIPHPIVHTINVKSVKLCFSSEKVLTSDCYLHIIKSNV